MTVQVRRAVISCRRALASKQCADYLFGQCVLPHTTAQPEVVAALWELVVDW